MDIKLAESLDSAANQLVDVPREEIRLVWSESDRDWQSHIARIVPNPAAGRHPRHHFINVKRAECSLEEVEKVTEMIDAGKLSLEKLTLDDILARLNRQFQHWLDHWTRIRAMGADALKVLPWGTWWLQEQGASRPSIDRPTGLMDEERRFLVQLGRMHLNQVISLFQRSQPVIRQCLIPHMNAREENWIYFFERGPNWDHTADWGNSGATREWGIGPAYRQKPLDGTIAMIYNIYMITIIDIPDDQAGLLAEACRRNDISRAEAICRTITLFLKPASEAVPFVVEM
jgi:hypothetical protein